jgi:pimeloyl-ACP methyl ester carboxylesterase
MMPKKNTSRILNVGDAKLHYEVYGKGPPVLLLHGGFGSAADWKTYIRTLRRHYQVIAIDTRGHGRSEIGSKRFCYRLFAKDTMTVLRHETREPAMVIGFSDGAITACITAALFPDSVCKVVALTGGFSWRGYRPWGIQWIRRCTPQRMRREDAALVRKQKAEMPEPERWAEFVEKMRQAWLQPVWVTPAMARKIRCPVLVVGGDRDEFFRTGHFLQIHESLAKSQLAIIPHAGHADVRKQSVLTDYIQPFLTAKPRGVS